MKNKLRVLLAGLWVVIASVFVTRWWLLSPSSTIIPDFPDAFWLWLATLFGVEGAEGMADLTIFAGFIISLIIVSSLTLVSWFLWRRIQGALTIKVRS
jgi:hypothetical protein